MNRSIPVLLLAAAALVFAGASADDAAPAQRDAAASAIPPFPPGFDWPANASVLGAAIARGDVAALRRHGWYLWAGLNVPGPDGLPVWRAWPTTSQAFVGTQAPAAAPPTPRRVNSRSLRALRAGNSDASYMAQPGPWYGVPRVVDGQCRDGSSDQLPDGERFQFNGDIMIAGVVYNEDAFDWIVDGKLTQAATLTAQWRAGKKDIAAFPNTSIVLKHMYWPIQGDKPTALPVWDPDSYWPAPPRYLGYEYWQRVVAIDPSGEAVPPGKTAQVSFLYHIAKDAAHKDQPLPTRTVDAKLVSISDFYHQRIDARTLAQMDAADRAILDAAACWLYDRPFRAGDLLASTAMHINSKEIPQWALQSLWWHDEPERGWFASARPDIPPSKAPGPWRHYLMTIEYGIEAAPGLLPVAFNPYIELAAQHPIETNCRNCHMRAAWPAGGRTPTPPTTASYLADGGPGPLADLGDDDPVFDGLMRLDFQWAISDRALPAGSLGPVGTAAAPATSDD